MQFFLLHIASTDDKKALLFKQRIMVRGTSFGRVPGGAKLNDNDGNKPQSIFMGSLSVPLSLYLHTERSNDTDACI